MHVVNLSMVVFVKLILVVLHKFVSKVITVNYINIFLFNACFLSEVANQTTAKIALHYFKRQTYYTKFDLLLCENHFDVVTLKLLDVYF